VIVALRPVVGDLLAPSSRMLAVRLVLAKFGA